MLTRAMYAPPLHAWRYCAHLEASMKSLGLLLLRLAAGAILIAHGYVKLFGGREHPAPRWLARIFGPNFSRAAEETGPEGFGASLEKLDVPAPRAAAYASGLAEFGGGLGLALGYHTRLAAPVVLANMGTAIRKVHWKNGLYGEGGFEFPLALAAIAGGLFLTGPGNISLDALRSARDDHADASHAHHHEDELAVAA
jgi:putative oxidoreductase